MSLSFVQLAENILDITELLAKCSQDAANRDIDDLVKRKVFIRNGGGRSTNYSLVE